MPTSDESSEKPAEVAATPPPAPASTEPWTPPVGAMARPTRRTTTGRRRGLRVVGMLVVVAAGGIYLLSDHESADPIPAPQPRHVAPAPARVEAPVALPHASPEPGPSAEAAPPPPAADASATETAESPPAPAPAEHAAAAEPQKPTGFAHPFVRPYDGSRWTVQVEAIKDLATASAERERLASLGLDVIVEAALVDDEPWQRILVGRYPTRAEAVSSLPGLREKGAAASPTKTAD